MPERYYVYTYDTNKGAFTPHRGLRCGPYKLFGLRRALRTLRSCGYDTKRAFAPSVLVTKYKEH